MDDNSNRLKVMWVDEDPLITLDYISEAKDYDIDLVNFKCWDDAKSALVEKFDIWSAIIIDPECKLHAGSYPNPRQLLPNLFTDLAIECTKRGRKLPWYILTSATPDKFVDMVIESRKEYDGEWPNPYYEKSTNRTLLFSRIRIHARNSKLLHLKNTVFKNIFKALNSLYENGLHPHVQRTLEDILLAMHYSVETKSDFKSIRKSLEYLFLSMIKQGFLPEKMNNANNIAIIGCSKLLANKVFVTEKYKFIPIIPVMNNIMVNNLRNIINICNSDVHAYVDGSNNLNLSDYLSLTESNNLLYSVTLQFCDILIWYAKILEEYSTKEQVPHFWKVEEI